MLQVNIFLWEHIIKQVYAVLSWGAEFTNMVLSYVDKRHILITYLLIDISFLASYLTTLSSGYQLPF